MRKWLTSLGYTLAILAIIFLLLPLVMGLLAEKKCKQIAEIINTTTPFNVKVTDYQRGWFNAHATAQISLDNLNVPNQELHQLTITAHITHGPILIDWARCRFVQAMINADITLNPIQNALLKRASDAGPIATTSIKFNLSGNTDITLNSPPLAYQDQENSLLWQGLKINVSLSPLCNQIKSKIDFSGTDINIKNHNFHIGKIISNHQGSKTSGNLWVGERNLLLDSFSTKNADNRTTAISGLNLHNAITDNDKNSVNVVTTIAINNLNINNTTYNQNNLNFEINGLSQALLAKLRNQLISNKTIPSLTNIGFDTLLTVLNDGGEINIKQLNTSTPWGKLLATLKMTFAKQPDDSGFLSVITSSTINTDIKTERALALHLLERFYPTKSAEEQLNTWQQSGKITSSAQDNFLHVIVDYKNGQLLINNKQLILTTKP